MHVPVSDIPLEPSGVSNARSVHHFGRLGSMRGRGGTRAGRSVRGGQLRQSFTATTVQQKPPTFAELFQDETWKCDIADYMHADTTFRAHQPRPTFEFGHLPNTYESLFRKFWSNRTLDKIFHENNRYATEEVTSKGYPIAGPN